MKPPEAQPKGHGFIPHELTETDYVFGGKTKLKGEVVNPSGDWTPFLPTGEFQAPRFETSACTIFGSTNAIETLAKFIFGEDINLADRFAAKVAGVDPRSGNTPFKSVEALRKYWSVEETSYPMEGVDTVELYYAPIPPSLFTEAKDYQREFKLGYEFVKPDPATLREALKRGTVCMSVALWPSDDGTYSKPPGWRDNHWVQLVRIFDNGDFLINDSYSPFLKTIKAGFLSEFAYRYELNEEIVTPLMKLIQAIKAYLAKYG